MMRWLQVFIGVWVICTAGFYVVWLVGLFINCAFIQGCFAQLNPHGLFAAVNGKSVLVKGTISAVAVAFIVWSRRKVR